MASNISFISFCHCFWCMSFQLELNNVQVLLRDTKIIEIDPKEARNVGRSSPRFSFFIWYGCGGARSASHNCIYLRGFRVLWVSRLAPQSRSSPLRLISGDPMSISLLPLYHLIFQYHITVTGKYIPWRSAASNFNSAPK